MSPVAGGEWQSGQKKIKDTVCGGRLQLALQRVDITKLVTGHTSFGFAEGMDRTVYGGYVRCITN